MSQDICEVLLTAIDILDERRAQISAVDDFTAFDNIEEEKAVAVASNPFGDILLQEQMQMESGTISLAANSAQTFTWPVNGINKGYDRLAISIKTGVEAKGNGNYGMRFTFIAANKDLSAAFDSSEFLGTPWMVRFDMLQKKLFDLSSLIDIQRIVVEFYNNSDTAVTFKEVSAILGYDLMNYSEKTSPLTLYVEGVENSELKYVTNAEGRLNATMSPNKIMINARWIYKEGDSARAITAANPGDLPEGAFIRWYKYCEEAPRGDQYGGSYYGLITNPNRNNPFLFQLNSDEFLTSADKTQIKAVIVYGEETYTSNLVVIRNDKSKSDEFFQNRGITLEDGSSGIYAYYDFDNNIKENFALETAVDRVAKVTYKKNFEGNAVSKVSKTIWKIPSGLLTYSGGSSSTFTEDGYDILETDRYVESITYRIKDAVPQTTSAYKIICIIYGLDGVQYTFEKEVSLILASNSGNPVIIRLLEGDKVVHAAESGKTYTISASIYNEKGEKIAPIYNEEEERIDSVSINYAPVAGINNELSSNIITITDAISSMGAIIKVTFQLSERNRVEEYFTIPVTNDVELWYKGPKSIVYASTGGDPTYGTGECYLYQDNVAVEGIEWIVNKYDNGQNPFYVPNVNGNILTPKNSYDSSMDKGYYLTASKNNSIIWVQPIAVYINRFFSRIINEWDGNLQVNEDGNYILASAYVAGSKNPNGEFTGTILGELGTINDNTSKTAANNGLFGYLDGAQSFGLRADGTAFFGTEGSGRIDFDGNCGIIESGGYTPMNKDTLALGQGTYLNLQTGAFDFGGGRLTYNGTDTLALRGVSLRWEDINNTPDTIKNLEDTLESLQDQVDGKAETWYQNTDPSTNWTTSEEKEKHLGDLWQYTGDTTDTRAKNSQWIWSKTNNNYSWVEMQVSQEVFDIIDGVASIYTTVPDAPVEGDLLIPISDIKSGDTVIYAAKKAYRYDGADWVALDYTDETTVQERTDALNEKLVKCLSGGRTTEIGSDYVISPYLGGGYLHITDPDTGLSVTIDPQQNDTNNSDGWVFRIDNSDKTVMGVDKDGTATFSGTIYAGGGTLGDFIINKAIYTIGKPTFDNNANGVYIGKDGIKLGQYFSVTNGGALNATNAVLTGTIKASAGVIGNPSETNNNKSWTIGYNDNFAYLQAGGATNFFEPHISTFDESSQVYLGTNGLSYTYTSPSDTNQKYSTMINSGLVMIQRPRASNVIGVAAYMRTGGFYLSQIGMGSSSDFDWSQNVKGSFVVNASNGKTTLTATDIDVTNIDSTNIGTSNKKITNLYVSSASIDSVAIDSMTIYDNLYFMVNNAQTSGLTKSVPIRQGSGNSITTYYMNFYQGILLNYSTTAWYTIAT